MEQEDRNRLPSAGADRKRFGLCDRARLAAGREPGQVARSPTETVAGAKQGATNGDHIYGDLKTAQNKPFAKFIRDHYWSRFGGEIDISVPMLHPRNAGIFLAACDYQIADLYGTTLRSTPAFVLQDDHDMFENDEFDRSIATLPPDSYGIVGAEETQRLYYPEFLPDANRPAWLPGAGLPGRAPGVDASFGTLRYGSLLEAILYDCRRYVNYKGAQAQVLPQWTEDWIVRRTQAEDTIHFLHVPSLPFAYSSGKLGDWYPDLLDDKTHRLTVDRPKDGWQPGWFAQHQRLIAALAAQKRRVPAVIQGDLHASAVGRMTRSGNLDLEHNPVHVAMTGTLGTGDLLFPSAIRKVETAPSRLVGMDQELLPTEKNGFTIIDVTPETMIFRLFAWRPPQPIELIDTMDPVAVHEVPRRA